MAESLGSSFDLAALRERLNGAMFAEYPPTEGEGWRVVPGRGHEKWAWPETWTKERMGICVTSR